MRKRRKNIRKRKAQATLLPTLLASVLVVVAVMSMSYLWMEMRYDSMGRQIKQLESERSGLAKELSVEENKWANTVTPANFERVLRRHGLAMYRPSESQVLRVVSAGNGRAVAAVRHNRLFMND